jgi:PhnB protein
MSVTTATHLDLRGAAREALDFHRSVFGGRTVAVTYKDTGDVRHGTLWDRLVEGSAVVRPREASNWAPPYGMLTDRFGVTLVLDVAAPYNG